MLKYKVIELDYENIKSYDLMNKFSKKKTVFFLDSSGKMINSDINKNQNSYIGINPIKEFKYYLNNKNDVFEKLKEFFNKNKIEKTDEKIKPQFLFYFSYDMGEQILDVKNNKEKIADLADIYGIICEDNWNFDHKMKKLYYIHLSQENKTEEFIKKRLSTILDQKEESGKYKIENLKSNFTYENYVKSIKRIKEHILDGDIYQINLSQMFTFKFKGDPFAFYKKIRKSNPAPFSAFVKDNEKYILSTSPERFVYKKGENIYTEPIKGTRPRGKNEEEDQKNYFELQESLKEKTENVMIVDLMRNDLGKISEYGTVKVEKLFYIEKYSTVFQLVSKISAKLKNPYDIAEIIKELIPGGSISGCPKKRAVEIIRDLEPMKRGLYTGCLGRISCDLEEFDFSILIRSILLDNEKAQLSLGGGITIDSDPHMEYIETINKGLGILEDLEEYLKIELKPD